MTQQTIAGWMKMGLRPEENAVGIINGGDVETVPRHARWGLTCAEPPPCRGRPGSNTEFATLPGWTDGREDSKLPPLNLCKAVTGALPGSALANFIRPFYGLPLSDQTKMCHVVANMAQ